MIHPLALTTPVRTITGDPATIIGRAFVDDHYRYDFMYHDRRLENNQPESAVAAVTGEPRTDIRRIG